MYLNDVLNNLGLTFLFYCKSYLSSSLYINITLVKADLDIRILSEKLNSKKFSNT